jgi:hypothetical protein
MGMNDYVLDDGITVVDCGDGWSIWVEPKTGKWRFDVWSDDVQRCVPLVHKGVLPAVDAQHAAWRLLQDAKALPALVVAATDLGASVQQRWPS